jgi:peptidyl-prolyl cis-trans isomerase B (cyclophilin B)
MGTEKRERQKENRRVRLEEQADAWRREQRRRRVFWYGALALLVIGGVVLVSFLKSNNKSSSAKSTSSTTAVPTSVSTPASVTVPPKGATLTGATPCPPADGSAKRTTTFAKPPPTCIDPAKTYTAVVKTDKGTFSITLDPKAAPKTVNNVPFHRVVKGFVIQGGDAVGPTPGQGGPGYTFADELPKSVSDYVPGSVAMANQGANTNGSQFFIWVGPTKLPTPSYSLFGKVTSGMDVVMQIEAGGGTDSNGTPVDLTTIQSVTITES